MIRDRIKVSTVAKQGGIALPTAAVVIVPIPVPSEFVI
jgi:hypothetical protein